MRRNDKAGPSFAGGGTWRTIVPDATKEKERLHDPGNIMAQATRRRRIGTESAGNGRHGVIHSYPQAKIADSGKIARTRREQQKGNENIRRPSSASRYLPVGITRTQKGAADRHPWYSDFARMVPASFRTGCSPVGRPHRGERRRDPSASRPTKADQSSSPPS